MKPCAADADLGAMTRHGFDVGLIFEHQATAMDSRPLRYSEQPTDWPTRVKGAGGTLAVLALLAAASLLTWRVVQPRVEADEPFLVELRPLAAPPEPVQEVMEGPRQAEQKEKPSRKTQDDSPAVPEIVIPSIVATKQLPQLTEPIAVEEIIPQTTAPKSFSAPPAERASSVSDITWEAQILAHLEKHRRYPASARARQQQGIAHIRFRMNREGRVLSSEVLRSSGSAVLDWAALKTLRRAQPLPRIPAEKPDPLELVVPVEFFVK